MTESLLKALLKILVLPSNLSPLFSAKILRLSPRKSVNIVFLKKLVPGGAVSMLASIASPALKKKFVKILPVPSTPIAVPALTATALAKIFKSRSVISSQNLLIPVMPAPTEQNAR